MIHIKLNAPGGIFTPHLGDVGTLDRGPDRCYDATVIRHGRTRVLVSFEYKNGNDGEAWVYPTVASFGSYRTPTSKRRTGRRWNFTDGR